MAAALLSVPATAQDVTTYDFEDGVALFTADSRIGVSVVDGTQTIYNTAFALDGKAVSFKGASNAQNGYSFAHFDFSSLCEQAAKVKVEFDAVLGNGARSIISIGDGAVRGSTGNSSKTTYSNKGAIFRVGSDKSNGYVNGTTVGIGTVTQKWLKVMVEVDEVAKTYSYAILAKETGDTLYSGSNTAFYSSDATNCTQIDFFGYINNSQMGLIDNLIITVTKDEREQAEYTVNFLDSSNDPIKEAATRSGAVGDGITLLPSDKDPLWNEDKTQKYIYADDDADGKVIAADGSTSVNVFFRNAEVYNYSLVSSLGATLATGTGFEGESPRVGYPRYQVVDGKLYKSDVDNKEYRKTVNLTEDNTSVTVAYGEVEANPAVVFYTEAEDIEGMTVVTNDNIPVRASNAKAAVSSEDVTITTLPVGKYIFHAGIFTSKSSYSNLAVNIGIGSRTFAAAFTSVNLNETASEEYVVTKDTDIKYLASSSANTQFDYIWIEKTGEPTGDEIAAAEAAEALAAAKAELQAAITAAQAIDTTDKLGVEELQAAIAAAEAALAAEDATVESLAAAKAALEQAVADFEAANAALAAAKAELQEAITAAEAIDTTDKVGVEELAAAIAAAKEALNDAEATVESLNAAKAALAEAVAAFEAANTVVEVTYIVNAEFNPEADPIGWDAVASDQYRDYGMYLIGGEQMVRFAAPTVDETHLATEFAAGVEARWATNFAAYTQTTAELPAGAYALTFDVENVNGGTTAAAYENRFTVTVGETVYTDESTEWMDGKSAWTTHAIKFILTEAAPITISLGYGTGSNNFGANNTPALYVSHLALEEIDAIEVSLSALESAIASAQAKAATYTVGDELFLYPESEIAPLKEAIATAQAAYDAKESIDAVVAATEALNAFVANFAPAINAPKQGQGYYIANTTATGNLNIATGQITVATNAIAFITAVEGGYVLSNGDGEYIFKTTNDWTLSTTTEIDEAYIVKFNKVEGGYTIQGSKGLFGLDNTAEGSTVYANKAQSNNGIWTVIEATEDAALAAAREALAAEIEAAKALKTAERTNGIEEFDAAIEAAEALLTSDVIEDINAGLAALRAAEQAFKMANIIVPEGSYYVMNAAYDEPQMFMAGGHNWGTKGIISEQGIDLKFTYDMATNTYTIDTRLSNGDNNHYLSNGLWMDGAPFGWTIEGDFVYTISAVFDGVKKYIAVDSNNELVLTEDGTADNAQWAFMMKDFWENEIKTSGLAALEAATVEAPANATFLIKSANFNRNDQRNAENWTIEADNKNLAGGGDNGNGCAESYHAAFTLSQQLADAPAGIYALTAQGFYRQDDNAVEDVPVFYANEETMAFPVKTGSENSMGDAGASFTEGNYTIEPIYVQVTEAGQLTVGAKGTATHHWVIWDNFQLNYYGANATMDEVKNAAILAELKQLREKATELKEQVEIEVVKAAIDEALAATADVTGAEAINAAIATMKAVVEQAEASVIAKNVLPKMKQFTEATNLYTAEAFDTYYTQWNTKYTEGTLTKDEANALQDPNAITGWRAANTVDDLLMSVWDAAPEAWDTYHVNTWSTEGETDGSDFKVPFIEYWVGDGESLAEKTLTATVTGLEAGDYEVSAWVRVRVKDGNTDSANGITLQVGEGEAIGATTGEQVGESQFYLATVTSEGTVAEDGQLTVKFNVAADNNISWLAFKNVVFTKKAVEPQPVEGLIYSWEGAADGATEEGGEIAGGGDEDRINYSQAGFYTICLRGKADYSTQYVTITLDEGSTINAGDEIAITAFRNKNETGKKAGAKMQFDNDASVTTGDGTEFVNLNAAVETSDEYGTEPNTVTVTVPEGVVGSKTIKITRSQTGTNLFITKLQVTKKKTSVGIEEVKDRQAIEAIYNLSGQKIEKTTKGLYIINGKKVVVK